MKKLLLTNLLILASLAVWSQETESISMGANYTNQVFYSLENGEISNISNTDWDIAFATSGNGAAGSSILINEATTKVWGIPQDTSFWSNIYWDTFTDEGSWERLLNSDTSWTNGAFNKYRGAGGTFDMGWGILNPANNFWTFGDSLYLIQLSDNSYKKLKITSLKSGVWEFQYADPDGQNKQIVTIDKANYTNKNFAYHSMLTNTTSDREPDNTTWDFVLMKHTDELAPGLFMPVTGVFTNKTIWTAKANENDYATAAVSVSPQTPYTQNVVNIGREWKNFSGGIGTVYDSIAYFLYQEGSSDIYRVVFTDFGWSATGTATFEITDLSTLASIDLFEKEGVELYPNPSNGEVTLLFGELNDSFLSVINIMGEIVYSQKLEENTVEQKLDLSNLSSGTYFVHLSSKKGDVIQKLVIQ